MKSSKLLVRCGMITVAAVQLASCTSRPLAVADSSSSHAYDRFALQAHRPLGYTPGHANLDRLSGTREVLRGLASAPVYPADVIAAGDLIVKDLAERVVAIPQPLTVYHYWSRHDGVVPLAVIDADIKNLVGQVASSFFDPQAQGETFSPGYYGALDPFVTAADYGGDNFGLIMTMIPTRSVFLNLTEGAGWKNSKIPIALGNLNSDFCSDHGSEQSPMATLLKNPNCRRVASYVMQQLMQKDRIVGIRYEWVAAKIDQCKNPNDGQAAVVILDPSIVIGSSGSSPGSSSGPSEIFSAAIPDNDPVVADRLAISSVQKTNTIALPTGMHSMALWPTLPKNSPQQDQAWMATHLYNCR